MRRGFVRFAAAAVVLTAAAPLPAAEPERLGACGSDDLICGTGDGAARVFADTHSPSRRLALAWRTPSGPPTEEPEEDDVELLLVRLSDGAILARQKGAAWATGESHSNRRNENAAWSPNSRLMVETYVTRFSTDGITVYAVGADDRTSTLDLLEVVEPAVRARLRRIVRHADAYVFSADRLTVDDRGLVRMTVFMWVPKDGPSQAFDVTAAVARKRDGLVARITAIRRSNEKL